MKWKNLVCLMNSFTATFHQGKWDSIWRLDGADVGSLVWRAARGQASSSGSRNPGRNCAWTVAEHAQYILKLRICCRCTCAVYLKIILKVIENQPSPSVMRVNLPGLQGIQKGLFRTLLSLYYIRPRHTWDTAPFTLSPVIVGKYN